MLLFYFVIPGFLSPFLSFFFLDFFFLISFFSLLLSSKLTGLILYGFDHYLRWASYKRYPTETVLVEPKEGHCRILLKQTRTESDIKVFFPLYSYPFFF